MELISTIKSRNRNTDGSVGEWEDWNPEPPFNHDHNLTGLLAWMKENESHGWKFERLMRSIKSAQVYHADNGTDFLVPMIMFRTRLNSSGTEWAPWRLFAVSLREQNAIGKLSPENLRKWMDENPQYGWQSKRLLPERGQGDPHLYVHSKEDETKFWIPDVRTPQAEDTTGKLFVCLNALGCETLTEGKAYRFMALDKDEGMVVVQDDSGVMRDFMLERFWGEEGLRHE